MKRKKQMGRQVRKRIKALKVEMEKLSEYVWQEIRAHPTEVEMEYMIDFEPGDYREHEMSVR